MFQGWAGMRLDTIIQACWQRSTIAWLCFTRADLAEERTTTRKLGHSSTYMIFNCNLYQISTHYALAKQTFK